MDNFKYDGNKCPCYEDVSEDQSVQSLNNDNADDDDEDADEDEDEDDDADKSDELSVASVEEDDDVVSMVSLGGTITPEPDVHSKAPSPLLSKGESPLSVAIEEEEEEQITKSEKTSEKKGVESKKLVINKYILLPESKTPTLIGKVFFSEGEIGKILIKDAKEESSITLLQQTESAKLRKSAMKRRQSYMGIKFSYSSISRSSHCSCLDIDYIDSDSSNSSEDENSDETLNIKPEIKQGKEPCKCYEPKIQTRCTPRIPERTQNCGCTNDIPDNQISKISQNGALAMSKPMFMVQCYQTLLTNPSMFMDIDNNLKITNRRTTSLNLICQKSSDKNIALRLEADGKKRITLPKRITGNTSTFLLNAQREHSGSHMPKKIKRIRELDEKLEEYVSGSDAITKGLITKSTLTLSEYIADVCLNEEVEDCACIKINEKLRKSISESNFRLYDNTYWSSNWKFDTLKFRQALTDSNFRNYEIYWPSCSNINDTQKPYDSKSKQITIRKPSSLKLKQMTIRKPCGSKPNNYIESFKKMTSIYIINGVQTHRGHTIFQIGGVKEPFVNNASQSLGIRNDQGSYKLRSSQGFISIKSSASVVWDSFCCFFSRSAHYLQGFVTRTESVSSYDDDESTAKHRHCLL